jgi:hypothetical protein
MLCPPGPSSLELSSSHFEDGNGLAAENVEKLKTSCGPDEGDCPLEA